ncbi:hypothetical protein K1719_006859 [Acacia pycnantha]|nr:hypothetical protein K1719_006859 [Acacia pycnantha]
MAQVVNVVPNLAHCQASVQDAGNDTITPFDPGAKPTSILEKGLVERVSLETFNYCVKNLSPMYNILAETHTGMESRFRLLGRMGYDSVRVIPSSGQSGGLAVGWMSSRINVSVLEEDRQFFHLYCQIPQLEPFYITAVYSIPYPCFKASLWESLLRLSRDDRVSMVHYRDFNEILANSERIGGGGGSYCRMRLFQERINDCRLTDIGAVGPKMTWKGPRLLGCTRLYERLDRVIE